MGLELKINTDTGLVTGGTLTFSREGLYYYMIVKGDANKLETTCTSDGSNSTVVLNKDWDTSLEATFDANIGSDGNYNDVWTKYQLDPDGAKLMEYDISEYHDGQHLDAGAASIPGYRTMLNRLVKRNASDDGYDSGTGFTDDSGWKTLKERNRPAGRQ